jgi:hypothetical protein
VLVAAAAVLVAGLTAVSVGAAQNRLPADLQDAVASTADLVGLHVPSSDDRPADAGDARSEVGADHARDDEAPVGAAAGSDGDPGYVGTTPGGALPADPGEVGDDAPATPAVPPDGTGPAAVPAAPDGPGGGAPEGAGEAGSDPAHEPADDRDEDDEVPARVPERAGATSAAVTTTVR